MRTTLEILLFISLIVPFGGCKKGIDPPSVHGPWIPIVLAGGVQCSGSISSSGGADIIERGFKWRTDKNPDEQYGKIVFDNGYNYFETIISGLSPSTTYFVKAYATNSEGIAYSIEKVITTSQIGTFTDSRDGRTYKWTEIGNQTWMAENLSYIPFISPFQGDSGIFVYNYKGYSVEEAIKTTEYKTYGCLYSWEISLQICPNGWHLPGEDEIQELEKSLGMTLGQIGKYGWHGTNQANLLKEAGSSHWPYPNRANNIACFSALPAGYHHREGDANGYIYFNGFGNSTYFWSSTIIDFPVMIGLASYNQGIMRTGAGENYGCSVRCIKD